MVPEHQHLYASEEELGQVFNFEFAKADWFAEDFRIAIREGLESAEESGSTTTWVMSNHDVVRHASRYGLPQVKTQWYHQLADAWLLRSGSNFIEDRELGTRRARAAIMMELGLPGSVYVYQGEELGLFEVADIPWDRLEDPTPFRTDHGRTAKGRDGCRVPLPWSAADEPTPAPWDAKFGTGASFGFSPATRPDGTPAADPASAPAAVVQGLRRRRGGFRSGLDAQPVPQGHRVPSADAHADRRHVDPLDRGVRVRRQGRPGGGVFACQRRAGR